MMDTLELITAQRSFEASASINLREAMQCANNHCPLTAAHFSRLALQDLQRSIDIAQHMMTWWPVQQVAA